MELTPKELMKQYVDSQNFTSTTQIMQAMKELFRDAIQQVMESELDVELGYEKSERMSDSENNNLSKNYRNGYSKKTVKTQLGEIEVKVPRDRNGEYEPKIIGKYNRNADGMEEKILSLYACGMSQRDIAEQIKNLYDVEISPELVSKISEKIMPEVSDWQNRPLEEVYPFVFMDAIHYKVKEDHRYITKAAYVVLGINMEGGKDILGIWIGENEGAKFWLKVCTELKNRGIQDILIVCIDGLKGFPDAIHTVFPQTRVQLCVIHQIRNTMKYVSYKDQKAFMKDLKRVYGAESEEIAMQNLESMMDSWKKYQAVLDNWLDKWENLSTYFCYGNQIRKLIYTTNTIEGFNRQLRKVTKNKAVFPTDDALKKTLYLCTQDIVKKWSMPYRDWGETYGQFVIEFGDRARIS